MTKFDLRFAFDSHNCAMRKKESANSHFYFSFIGLCYGETYVYLPLSQQNFL